MLIKDKEMTSYQLLLKKQDRVLENYSTWFFDYSESGIFIYLFIFYFSKKMGRSGDGKRNILLGWPNDKKTISLQRNFQNNDTQSEK